MANLLAYNFYGKGYNWPPQGTYNAFPELDLEDRVYIPIDDCDIILPAYVVDILASIKYHKEYADPQYNEIYKIIATGNLKTVLRVLGGSGLIWDTKEPEMVESIAQSLLAFYMP